ncbi:MAG: ArsR/SmtB family transcription factor [Candidatus Heimdallarchaeaceae archaeon]
MSDGDENKNEIFLALSHPIRRQILEEIYAQGFISYTELVELTKLKPGPLYHHLKKIKQFIYQTENKLYRLTDEGYRALELLRAVDKKDFRQQTQVENYSIIRFFGLSFSPLIKYFSKNPYRTFVEFIILSILCSYFASESDILLVGTFVVSKSVPFYISFLSIFFSWLVIAGLTELIILGILRKRRETFAFITSLSLSFIPMFLFFIITWVISYSFSIEIAFPLYSLLIIHGFFQLWLFMIISTAIGELKILSVEKSSIIALGINYLQTFIIIFLIIK